DPRPVMACGPDATVKVDGQPLQPGALVPGMAFELEWLADGCRPFGLHGPTFSGSVRLTVFREEWGFSAMVQPSSLYIALEENTRIAIPPRGVATLPQIVEADAIAEAL